ncbi:MAG: hypothetical protein C0504_19730 [Candidatus Solibacter sp.]|nr:hypothetical protein [Candidatus Solibacter sp.]
MTAWIQDFGVDQETAGPHPALREETSLQSRDFVENSGAGASLPPPTRLWTASSGSPSIRFDPALLEEIRAESVRALHGMGKGGIEIGGILLGTIDDTSYSIQSWRPIRCDYARGSSFLLSARDLATLSCQVEAVQADPAFAGLRLVGWFVSHTRGSLDPRLDESQLHTRLFNIPGSLLLTLKPGRFGDAEVAIHTFEPGDPPSLRPLDPLLPLLTSHSVKPPAGLDFDTAPPPLLSDNRFGTDSPPSRRRWLAAVAAVAGFTFLTIGAIAIWNSSPAPHASSQAPTPPPPLPSGPPLQLLSLHLEATEDAIRVSWDTSSAPLRNLKSGSLSVWDQGQVFVRQLSPDELRLGSIEYTRSLGEVRVQLTIQAQDRDWSETAHYAPFRIPD